MTALYKLTTQNNKTRAGEYNETTWGEGVEHTAPGEGPLCSEAWLHAYTSPLLALMLNPIHANLSNPKLWECDGDVGHTDGGLKVGCTRLRTLREIPLPQVTTEQRVRFAILCALKVYKEPAFVAWAEGWLSGKDRTARAARAARAAWAASEAAARAAWAASEAAARASDAEASEAAARASEAEARASEAEASEAAAAAAAAAEAAEAAEAAAKPIDLIALAEQAIREEQA